MDSSAPTCYRCGKVDFTNHSCNPAEVYRTATPTPRTSNGSLNVQNRLVSLRIDRSLSSKKKSIKVKKVNITFFQGALIPDSDDIFNEKIIQLSTVGLNYLFSAPWTICWKVTDDVREPLILSFLATVCSNR